MNISMRLMLIPSLLVLSACGKNSDVATTPTPDVSQAVVHHNPNECPASLNGEYANRRNRLDRARFTMVRRGNMWVLTRSYRENGREIGDTIEVTGQSRPVMIGRPPRAVSTSSYVAGCSQGRVIIKRSYHRHGRKSGEFDMLTTIIPGQGVVRVLTQSRESALNSDLTYDLVRRPGPIVPRR